MLEPVDSNPSWLETGDPRLDPQCVIAADILALEKMGLLEPLPGDRWGLTPAGRDVLRDAERAS